MSAQKYTYSVTQLINGLFWVYSSALQHLQQNYDAGNSTYAENSQKKTKWSGCEGMNVQDA